MTENFAELYDTYASNILSRTMVDALADELGVTSESLLRLGLGYFPGGGDRAFIMPERDNFGNIVGLVRRFRGGKKYMIKGSKRGLYYELNPEFTGKEQRYAAGKHNWIRLAAAGVECPVCGREDWCLVSADDPYDPRAVLCSRVSEGSTRHIKGSGFLHIRKPEGELCSGSQGPLLETESPIIVVEGYSDAATAIDLGFVAIGRPSAESGTEILPSLVRGREVIIIGDNDDGAGERGMEATFIALSSVCKRVVKVMPPKQFKDLRQWKNGSDLTKEGLIEWAEGEGEDTGDPDILPDDVASTIADRWIHLNKFYDGLPTVRNYKGQWLNWEDGRYVNYDEGELRGELYRFVDGKLFSQDKPDGEIKLSQYRPTRSKISDIVDALGQWCYTGGDTNPPVWLRDNGLPDPVNLIAFKNGILDVEEYARGKIKLYTPTPALFSFNVLPYDFDEDAHSELWDSFCSDVFNGERDKIELLSQWFGYNCVPDMQYEKLMFCTGRPRSGKGTVANTLTALLGEGQCASTSFQSLSSGFGYQNMIGKLAVMMCDERVAHRAQAISALEKILKVVGSDSVPAQRKFLSTLDLHLTCRFTIVANDLPDIPDSANALKPRLNVLHFENSYAGREDTTLKRRLKQEASEGKLINFALEGLKSLKETGKFVVPQSSHAIINQMEEIAAPVTAFVRDCCNSRPPGSEDDYHVVLNEIYEAWSCWCKDTGTFNSGMQHFGQDLLQACPSIKKRRLGVDGKRYHVYEGILLTEETKNKYLGRY